MQQPLAGSCNYVVRCTEFTVRACHVLWCAQYGEIAICIAKDPATGSWGVVLESGRLLKISGDKLQITGRQEMIDGKQEWVTNHDDLPRCVAPKQLWGQAARCLACNPLWDRASSAKIHCMRDHPDGDPENFQLERRQTCFGNASRCRASPLQRRG